MSIEIPFKSVNLGMRVLDWANLGSPHRENYLAHLQAKGVQCIRMPWIWGDILDPNNPNWAANAANYALFVQECYQHGIETTAVIHSDEGPGAARDQHLYDLTVFAYQHAGPSGSWWGIWGYSTYLACLIYEVYNEPNTGIPTGGTVGYPYPADYGRMITPIYQQLRCPGGPGGAGTGYNDGRVRVVCGGLRYSQSNPPDVWLNGLINSGSLYCDHICIHPYPKNWSTTGNADATAMVTNCQNVLNNHSATQQLLITEYAYPANVSEADQKSHSDAFLAFAGSRHVAWFPAANVVAEGFSGSDSRLATTSDWTTFHDRAAFGAFVSPNTMVVIP